MIKQCFFNYFKRFKYFFVCFGIILLGFAGAFGIFYGGLLITLNAQDAVLQSELIQAFKNSFINAKPYDIISLNIFKTIYQNSLDIAGTEAMDLKIGITLSALAATLAIFGAYKGSVSLVNYLNKRILRNKFTKKGFTPFIIKLIIGGLFSLLLLVLLHLWEWSFIFVILIYVFVDAFEAIVSIRYIYFSNRDIKQFLSSKKFIKVMGVFLVYQYAIILLATALWFASPILSLFLMVPALAYNETNIQYTIISAYK